MCVASAADDHGGVAEPAPPTSSLVLRCGYATAAGHRRSLNEDAVGYGPAYAVVADGMGGHAAGEVASRLAVEALAAAFGDVSRVTVAALTEAVQAANRAIHAGAQRDGTHGMGTTLVGLVLTDDGLVTFHAGDSRCYRLASGDLSLVTRDHSLVEELIGAGRLDRSASHGHPMGNVVTRALGVEPTIECEVAVLAPVPCRFLLCSDGLSNELPARAIGRVLAGVREPQLAARRLVDLVLEGPASDNVTALVCDVIAVGSASGDDGVPVRMVAR